MNYSNIEKSGFHTGEYVGYGGGKVFRIRKTNSTYGNWIARDQNDNAKWEPIYAFTLRALSDKLAVLKAD